MVEFVVFAISAAIVLGGALGVIGFRNPVHNALSLIATLFGVAVLFIAQEAYFLAAVQIIVYAGAIVVLFLFVIMLVGVDRLERLDADTLKGQQVAAAVVGGAVAVLSVLVLFAGKAGAPLTRPSPGRSRVNVTLKDSRVWCSPTMCGHLRSPRRCWVSPWWRRCCCPVAPQRRLLTPTTIRM